MNILCIGDPHGNLDKVKRMPLHTADAIIITGDLGDASLDRAMDFENIRRRVHGLPPKEFTAAQRRRGYMQTYTTGVRLVKHLAKHAPVYLIFGNAERSDRDTKRYAEHLGTELPSITKALRAIQDVRIINGKSITLHGKSIGGIGFFWDGEKRSDERAAKALERIGTTDILVCHQPPYGVLDQVRNRSLPKKFQGRHVGSEVILQHIRKQKPSVVLCGHIHEGKGTAKIGKTVVHNLGECGHKLLKL